MTAQLISQVSSHFIIHYHRRVVSKATNEYKQQNQLVEAGEAYSSASAYEIALSRNKIGDDAICEVRKHTFGRPHRGESEKLIVRRGIDQVLVAIAIGLTIFVILGCSLPSFSLDILGIIGVAVESGNDFQPAVTEHTVFTIVKLLMDEARFLGRAGDYIGLATLSILLIFSVLIVPILQSMALLRQWFYPSTRKAKRRMAVLIEILQAWQYAEVYLMALLVTSW